jgi:hypothetical protein
VCVASLGEILYLDFFFGSYGFVYIFLGQNHASESPTPTNKVLESANYKHENTGADHNF